MILVGALILLAIGLANGTVRRALPFESALALGATAAITIVLFQLGKLA